MTRQAPWPLAKCRICAPRCSLGLCVGLAVVFIANALSTSRAWALERGDFGWRIKESVGTRPLLVIWIREPDDTPTTELDRRKQHYEDLVFGRPGHAKSYPDLLRQLELSVVDYFRDASGGKFTWTRAGFLGPLSAAVKGKSDSDIARLALTAAASQGHVNFRKFDANRDGKITSNELTVLVISKNVGNAGGSANHFGGGGSFKIPGQDVTFAGGDAVAREGGAFAGFNHELFHTLGGIDLYGPWHGCLSFNEGLSLMTSTNFGPDDERILELDAWHKMLVGWIEPRLVAIGRPGQAQLAAQHLPLSAEPERKRPLLVYDERKGKSEFFLLEYRTPFRLGYDKNVVTSGLVIWHVAYSANGQPAKLTSERQNCKGAFVPVASVFVRGAPEWQQGISKAWTSVHGEIALRWMNRQDSGVRVKVAPHKPTDPIIAVSWSAPVPVAPSISKPGQRAQTGVTP
jgi:M6 family metalloprotease-like protein